MKRLLYILVAASGLAGCAEKLADTSSPSEKGELERSYISVTLKSDDASVRAAGSEDFEYGDAAERYVENVHFFLFKGDGTAFPISPAGNRNYLSFNINSNGTQPDETGNPNEGPNVSDVKDKILVFDNYKGEYPEYIVAVLNWDTKHIQPSYTLDNLYNALAGIRNTNNHFVMSSTVYADLLGKVVRANTLTVENIARSEQEAKDNPVEIYVERISAKVQVVADGDVAGKTATYDIGESVDEVPVYAKVLNWELYNEYHHSIVLKHIYPETWGMAGQIGFLWNDPNRFRSYWAGSYSGAFPADNHFDWLNDGLVPNTDIAYCGENTRPVVKDGEGKVTSDPRTNVIIKAQLVKADGEPIEVANWYGHNYIGEQAVRDQVASLISSQIYYKEGEEYKPIATADLKVVEADEAPAGTAIEAYEGFFQLADGSVGKAWKIWSNAEGFKDATADEINARLLTVEPAMIYKNGMTYYFTPVRHLGSTGSDSEFGVVRNHVYKVNISDISGFGTPVYDGDTDIETPQRPADIKSYVAAEVRILSWKVVKNNYSVN